MSYSWILPEPATPTPTPSGTSSASSRTTLGGLFDQELDPITLDFIDTDDGEWSETPDSRSIVLCQLELELGKSYNTPGDGTRIRAQLEDPDGAPVTTQFVISECRRALAILESLGIIGSVQIVGTDERGRQLTDETGRAMFLLSWLDLATGSPVEDVYRPLGG